MRVDRGAAQFSQSNCCNIAISFIETDGHYRHIESQHPPHKEYCNNCSRNMDDPVATCFRIAEIEHDGIVARGSKKASIGS